jgi:hypothetical protein
MIQQLAMPWLRRSAAALSPRVPGFDHRAVSVGFVGDRLSLGQIPLPGESYRLCVSV